MSKDKHNDLETISLDRQEIYLLLSLKHNVSAIMCQENINSVKKREREVLSTEENSSDESSTEEASEKESVLGAGI